MNPFYSNLSFKKSLKIIDLFLINIFQTFVRKILTPNTAVFCITLFRVLLGKYNLKYVFLIFCPTLELQKPSRSNICV